MEITKVVKPFIRRGANTFANIVYAFLQGCKLVTGLSYLLHFLIILMKKCKIVIVIVSVNIYTPKL